MARKPKAAPLEFDPDETPQVVSMTESIPGPADPYLLADAGLFQTYCKAHDKLFQDLGGSAIVAAQSVEPAGARAGRDNIVGSFVGRKYSAGKPVPGLALVVQVKRKITNASAIDSNVQIPPKVKADGVEIRTDVLAVGEIEALGYQTYRQPTLGGDSIGHGPTGITGTLGALCVTDFALDNQGKVCILSNNHVIAAVNTGAEGTDRIMHPGASDARGQTISLGRLFRYVQIDLSSAQSGGATNYVDAALAWTTRQRVSASHHSFTIDPEPLFDWRINQQVKKDGRTTDYTEGRIIGGNGRTIVKYNLPGGGTAFGYFEDQLVIEGFGGLFSDVGDSGSLIVDLASNQPVGLLFAGGFDNEYRRSVTYANPIAPVMKALKIDYFVAQ